MFEMQWFSNSQAVQEFEAASSCMVGMTSSVGRLIIPLSKDGFRGYLQATCLVHCRLNIVL